MLVMDHIHDSATETDSERESQRGSNPDVLDTYPAGCFEGPEKTMEVWFRKNVGPVRGLRGLSRAQVDQLCTLAKCSVLSSMSNDFMDAYVLSESSLFIHDTHFMMKTCGTTTLLFCLSTLLEFADQLGMEAVRFEYSRKNLIYPSAQLWPHTSFGEEVDYITTHEVLQTRLRGSGSILGPMTEDHWFIYVADIAPAPSADAAGSGTGALATTSSGTLEGRDRTFNVMMFDIAPEVAGIFYENVCVSGPEMTKKAGIATLCPGACLDENAFTPCGYSMNGILGGVYYTIHITPEPKCSYVSFETNESMPSYDGLLQKVLGVFQPKRFMVALYGDEAELHGKLPQQQRELKSSLGAAYTRTAQASAALTQDFSAHVACFHMQSAQHS